jgi:hypothetical protein
VAFFSLARPAVPLQWQLPNQHTSRTCAQRDELPQGTICRHCTNIVHALSGRNLQQPATAQPHHQQQVNPQLYEQAEFLQRT